MPLAWWEQPRRIVQTNLQVTDAQKIDPERLVAAIADDLHGDTLVFNVGGIYAWYPTKILFHTINPYLESGRDLVGEVLAACHARDLKFIARVDFSKADDSVYHQHPEWFVQRPDGSPVIVGEPRPGAWSNLYLTCAYGPYRNTGVAIPVLHEIVERYEVDAIFLNAAEFPLCFCASCRERYQLSHGRPMPLCPEDVPVGWTEQGYLDNISILTDAVEQVAPRIPWIAGCYVGDGRDMVTLHAHTGCILCTEPLDRFADGIHQARPRWWAGANASLAAHIARGRRPFVIVHACSGLAWRHASLPPAEHRFWLAEVAAFGGSIWHSLTGIPATQYDRRILRTVAEHNKALETVNEWVAGTTQLASVAVIHSRQGCLSNAPEHTSELCGALEALTSHHLLWMLYPDDLLGVELPKGVSLVVLPDVREISTRVQQSLVSAVQDGLGLIVMGHPGRDGNAHSPQRLPLEEILPVQWRGHVIRDTYAAYGRLTKADWWAEHAPSLSEVALVPWRGPVLVGECRERAAALLTLVPSFAPPDGVGAPPERAVIPTEQTHIPLVAAHTVGKGLVVQVMGRLGELIHTYRLPDHIALLASLARYAGRIVQPVEVEGPPGLIVGAQAEPGRFVVHLANGVGERPLARTASLNDVVVRLPMAAGGTVTAVSLRHPEGLPVHLKDGTPSVRLTLNDAWEVIHFTVGT